MEAASGRCVEAHWIRRRSAGWSSIKATEKAIAWLVSLTERPFAGTESRLLTLFALLEQISAGTEADPVKRVEDLRQERDALLNPSLKPRLAELVLAAVRC